MHKILVFKGLIYQVRGSTQLWVWDNYYFPKTERAQVILMAPSSYGGAFPATEWSGIERV